MELLCKRGCISGVGKYYLVDRLIHMYRSPAATPLERLTGLTDHSGGEDAKPSRWAFQPLSSADSPDSSGVWH